MTLHFLWEKGPWATMKGVIVGDGAVPEKSAPPPSIDYDYEGTHYEAPFGNSWAENQLREKVPPSPIAMTPTPS